MEQFITNLLSRLKTGITTEKWAKTWPTPRSNGYTHSLTTILSKLVSQYVMRKIGI